MSVGFLLTSLLVVATPGIGVFYTMSAGLSRGARAGVIAAIGCTLGILPHMLAAITGLAALLRASPLSFEILKYVGVAYLLYMAWAKLRDKDGLAVEEEATPGSPRQIISSGVLANLLNPKLTIFFFAFLPQFVNTRQPGVFVHMLELSAVFMLLTFVVFVIYGKFAAMIRSYVASRPRVLTWMGRIFAGGFVALAVKLAFSYV